MSNYVFNTKDIYPDAKSPEYQISFTNYLGHPSTRLNEGAYWDARSAAWKKALKTFARKNPDIMYITKSGNGANVNVGDLHIGSQGTATIAFNMAASNLWFRMGYHDLKTLEINTADKLVIINGRLAIRYEN